MHLLNVIFHLLFLQNGSLPHLSEHVSGDLSSFSSYIIYYFLLEIQIVKDCLVIFVNVRSCKKFQSLVHQSSPSCQRKKFLFFLFFPVILIYLRHEVSFTSIL